MGTTGESELAGTSWCGRDPGFVCLQASSFFKLRELSKPNRRAHNTKEATSGVLCCFGCIYMYIFMLRGRKMWEKARKNREAEAHNKSHWRILFRPLLPSSFPCPIHPGRTLAVADYDEALSTLCRNLWFNIIAHSLDCLYHWRTSYRVCCVFYSARTRNGFRTLTSFTICTRCVWNGY